MFDDDKCGFQHKLDDETRHLSAKVVRNRKNIEKLERKLRVDAMSWRSDTLYRAFSALHERERTATHE